MKWSPRMRLRRSFKFVGIMLMTTLTIVIALVIAARIVTVAHIEVIGTPSIRGLDFIRGSLLPLISAETVQDLIIARNPQIESVLVVKKYPNTLRLVVTVRPVVAQLEGADGFFSLTSKARIVEKATAPDPSLTRILYYQKFPLNQYAIGETLDLQDIQTALFFTEKFARLGLALASIDIQGQDMITLQTEAATVLFSSRKDTHVQMTELETIMKRFRLEGREFETLDLRFEKPVVVYR